MPLAWCLACEASSGQLAGIQLGAGLWVQVDDADGQAQQIELLALALAVGGAEAAGLQVFGAIEAPALGLKIFLQLVQALAPVG